MPASSRLQLVVEMDVPEVVDLLNAATLEQLGATRKELVALPDWTRLDGQGRPAAYELSQCIGELTFLVGAGGILFPPARATEGRNLVVLTDNLARVGGAMRTTNPFTGQVHSLP